MTDQFSIWRDGKVIGFTKTLPEAKAWAKKQAPAFGVQKFEIHEGESMVGFAELNGAERAKWKAA